MKLFILYILIGMLGQLIDGSMGMAYGVTCSTFLRAFTGLPAATASASIHFAEIFTTCSSAISHIKLHNVDKKMFYKLLLPGVIGGVTGAVLLSRINLEAWEIIIDVYLIIIGISILSKVRTKKKKVNKFKKIPILGFVGGASDAIGGGGWGPIVTSTLIASDHDVRTTIGTVNSVEFFITVTESIVFFFLQGNAFMRFSVPIVGLIIGGVIVSPFAAFLCTKLPKKIIIIMTGLLIILINSWSLICDF